MPPASAPGDEARRLAALRAYGPIDAPPEPHLDDISRLAAHICDTPIAYVTLVDGERQWIKSVIGYTMVDLPREHSFCRHTIQTNEVMVVPDALNDSRFAANPYVVSAPHLRFYAGAPLVTHDGLALGALCVADYVPRELTAPQRDALTMLSRQVLAHLELRKRTNELIVAEQVANNAAEQSALAAHDARELFMANPLVMWIYDPVTLQFLEVNDAAVRRYGYSRAEFLSMTIRDIRPEQDLERLEQIVAAPKEQWRMSSLWRHRLKSGKVIDVDITSHEVVYGGRAGVLVAVHDITERLRAQEAQRRSDESYRRLFDTSPDGLVVVDSNRNYLDCNPSACRMLGYTHDEFVKLNASHIVAASGSVEVNRKLEVIRAANGRFHELQFQRKDGSIFSAEVNATPLPNGTTLGIIRDMTERNEALDALRLAEERMRYALQSADVGIWDTNLLTGEVKWSDIEEKHYGFAPGTFPGTHEAVIAILHPDDRHTIDDLMGVVASGASELSVTHRAVWPDGSVHWIQGIGRIDRDHAGNAVRATGVSLDITARRELEEQYQQAQKMEAIGRLAGGVAHDFNNLLTAILGYCELLLADKTSNSRHDLEEIRKAGMRAATLTRQLLAFSRREIIAPALLDLNEVVTDMKSMLQRLIGEDVRVQMHLRPGALPIKADRGQLEQIVMNLAVNARDAMPKGGVLTLETSNALLDAHFQETHFRTEREPFVALTVRDNGTGMSPEVQARVFEPFFTTKEVGKGTGLGLATVHGIVHRAGGAVTVHSELGVGTAVKVMFPAASADDQVAPEIHPQPRSSSGAETVLVVEDEDALRELTRRLLLRQGYQVHVAANAEEAVAIFQRTRPDVLLTDVVMPGSSGPELMARLATVQPGLKVVYMSGYTDEAIVHHGVLEPDVAFVHKPFTSDSLARTLREVLDR